MKLYEVPPNSKIRVLGEGMVPPSAPAIHKGDVLNFHHIDGMYSYCENQDGDVVHLAAFTEVEIVDKTKDNENK